MKRILTILAVVALGAFALSACGHTDPNEGKDEVDLLDLLHPEDVGTMTHWYSRTPHE